MRRRRGGLRIDGDGCEIRADKNAKHQYRVPYPEIIFIVHYNLLLHPRVTNPGAQGKVPDGKFPKKKNRLAASPLEQGAV